MLPSIIWIYLNGPYGLTYTWSVMFQRQVEGLYL